MKKFNILTFNSIAPSGLALFDTEHYHVGPDVDQPDAVMLRSHDLHGWEIPASVKVIGRTGAGVNNIPVEMCSQRGIPVFNAPGANANAVKELVIAAMLLASRHICQAWHYVSRLEGDRDQIKLSVEQGKKQFAGFELPGRTLGVVGLGAIGVKVANAAISLGMKVIGYDPAVTIKRAWELDASVVRAENLEEVMKQSDFITLHVPLLNETRGLINEQRLSLIKPSTTILNFARGELVDTKALATKLESQQCHAYISDFPSETMRHMPNAIFLPHLGASTQEAEENCAKMIATQLKEFLETGSITNSVNYPEMALPKSDGIRIAIANANVPNMVGQITTDLAKANLNIIDLMNRSRDNYAYTLIDVDGPLSESILGEIKQIQGVLTVRVL